MAGGRQPSPGDLHEPPATRLPLPRDGLEQQRRVERGRRAAGFLHRPGLLPDDVVPLGILVLFLVLLWAAYQLRVRQLAHQFNMTLEARVSERTRIARELHDTLLQSFQGLLLRFQSVSKLLPERPDRSQAKA